ncbi:hypothetical protein Moror_318 [Moniliophthora roreri MCA 2997]|uniref:WHIM1 domain-containing protein n=1 Tax=Moniliophthora roreri (strain MCA 2997) TaxID=1381753 RepID=V2XZB9_MONRO|nr:hypothetical protein Moror_318 [Moniliophthora roreri MCA 2997]
MSGRGHVCPPSDAIHPSDRWESLFIYSFICKFTKLREKVEGLETPMDLENALLSNEPNTIVNSVLTRFILNLRPQARNLSTDQLSTTVASVLADYFKTPERTVFWDEDLHRNVDPLQGLEGGFYSASWDLKLKILRQLVELQLTHSAEIKGKIDRAWGVYHNKNKKKDGPTAPPPSEDPESQENLQLQPLGQDITRKRYWVADLSPRIYVSTNPWKITATFQTISSTREEYVAAIEQLKSNAPEEPKTKDTKSKSKKRPKTEIAHLQLIKGLEERLEDIDKELARVQKVRKKIEQRQQDLILAECRQLRSRRQTRRPAYYDNGGVDSEDEGDEYKQAEEENYEDDYDDPDAYDDMSSGSSRRTRGASSAIGQRRSTRTAVLNANGKREAAENPYSQWRGERRSARLGAPPELQLDYEPESIVKRARTEDSVISANSSEPPPSVKAESPAPSSANLKVKLKNTSAAALKPTEVALEEFGSKKKSKYWVYAVEPIPGAAPPAPTHDMEVDGTSSVKSDAEEERKPSKPFLNGNGPHTNGHTSNGDLHSSSSADHDMELRRSMEGSLSPIPMDET